MEVGLQHYSNYELLYIQQSIFMMSFTNFFLLFPSVRLGLIMEQTLFSHLLPVFIKHLSMAPRFPFVVTRISNCFFTQILDRFGLALSRQDLMY